MKKSIIVILMLVLVLALVGCTKKKAEEVIKPENEMMIIEEEPDNELEIIEEPIIEDEIIMEEEPVINMSEAEYKVQLFATYDEMKANKVADELKPKFTDEVYVEYIAPYYKVRVGHFATKEQAEMARNIAREKGYADAFIVLP